MLHLAKHRRSKNKSKYSPSFIDKIIYPIAVVSPLAIVPQLIDIWIKKNVSGVSFTTWAIFSVISLIWIFYGIKHKDYPVIVTNVLLFLFNVAVCIGIFVMQGTI